MKKVVLFLAATVALGTGIPTQPVTAATEMDRGIVSAERIDLAATIETIDHERRLITLKIPDGKFVTLRASKQVKNFGELAKGNPVTVGYLDSVAVIVRKPDGISQPGYLKEVSVTQRGDESDELPVDTVASLGSVESIDYGLRTVTFKGADGVIKTYKVDPRVKKFRDIYQGDKIYLRVTEPLALRIRPAN